MNYQFKITCTFLLLAFSSFTWGQVIKNHSFKPKPEILELEVKVSSSGDANFYHNDSNSEKSIKTLFMGNALVDHSNKLMMADIDKIFCDGNFEYAYDFHGAQYILLTTIKVCIDEDGFIVAHSLNTKVSDQDELAASIRKIEMNRNMKSIAVNEDSGIKKLRGEKIIPPQPQRSSTSKQ